VRIVVEFQPTSFIADRVYNKKEEIIRRIERVFKELGFTSSDFSVYLTWREGGG